MILLVGAALRRLTLNPVDTGVDPSLVTRQHADRSPLCANTFAVSEFLALGASGGRCWHYLGSSRQCIADRSFVASRSKKCESPHSTHVKDYPTSSQLGHLAQLDCSGQLGCPFELLGT
jgi:hypothetical protein